MFKRWLSAVLVVLMLGVGLCGCSDGGSDGGADPKDVKAIVDGQQVSANEIIEKTGTDPMAFYNNYGEKKVKITGTVDSVNRGFITMLSRNVEVYKVYLKEGWVAHMPVGVHPELENLQSGASVTIESRIDIYDSASGYIVMEDIGISGSGYSDDATIVIH